MAETISIRINIAGKSFSLKVDKNQVETIKLAEKMVNSKIHLLKEDAGVADTFDLLSMTAFDIAVDKVNQDNDSTVCTEVVDRIISKVETFKL